jgi:hypothetical protein
MGWPSQKKFKSPKYETPEQTAEEIHYLTLSGSARIGEVF